MILKGKDVYLRHPILSDLKALLTWENDPEIWQYGDYSGPFSKEDILNFIGQGQDLNNNLQERLMIISNESEKAIGCIDLYDFDPLHRRAGIGILIYSKEDRRKGLASEALAMLIKYAKEDLILKQLYCAIEEHNEHSLSYFKKHHFEEVGLKKAWRIHNGKWYNEYLLQLILN